MVALIVATLALLAGCGLVMAYAKRRPVGTTLTWGEAMIAATFAFFLMFLAYGVVPHQWLAWADNDLQWRSDKVLNGPGDIFASLPFDLNYQVIRDIIASVIYVIGLGGQIAMWSAWQKRGRPRQKEIAASAYGRPLVKRA